MVRYGGTVHVSSFGTSHYWFDRYSIAYISQPFFEALVPYDIANVPSKSPHMQVCPFVFFRLPFLLHFGCSVLIVSIFYPSRFVLALVCSVAVAIVVFCFFARFSSLGVSLLSLLHIWR